MGGSDSPPPPTPTEVALQQEQINQLRAQNESLARQERQFNLLQPILLAELGFDPELDPNTGEIIGVKEREPDEQEAALQEIERLSSERALAALKGELPVDPALLSDLEDRRQALDEGLRQDFGSLSAGRSSTPGIERIRDFEEFEQQALDQARRGDLTLATNLALQTRGQNVNEQLAAFNVLGGGAPQLNPGNVTFQQIAQDIGNERRSRFAIEEEQRRNSQNTKIGAISSGAAVGGTIGAAFGGIGAPIGAGIGAGFGALASRNA